MGHEDAKIVREGVYDAAPDAAARRTSRDDEAVRSRVDQIARERRPEEGARVLLRQEDVGVPWRDLGREFVALGSDIHDGRDLVRKPAAVEGLLGRYKWIENRPIPLPEPFKQSLDPSDRGPGDIATGGRVF